MKSRLSRIGAVAVLLLFTSAAQAWNREGHSVIGLIAWSQMDDATQDKAVSLIRQHPRFDQHFVGSMPPEVWNGSDAEKDQWLFVHANYWADTVRSKSDVVTREDARRFHRSNWHWVNLPIFLSDADRDALKPGLKVNLETEPAAEDDRSMNVVQAIAYARNGLADSDVSQADKAVHLCWLLHLAGDVHQPCHSSALFTPQRFPTGDRGGNELHLRGRLNVHAFWDRAILDRANYNRVRRQAFELGESQELAEAGSKAEAEQSAKAWATESYQVAQRYVYTPHVREAVADAEGLDRLGSVNSPKDYEIQASKVAQRRAVEAGYRIGAAVKAALVNVESGATPGEELLPRHSHPQADEYMKQLLESDAAPPAASKTMVWVTDSGEKYHRENCRFCDKSGRPIELQAVKAAGMEPCKVCRPAP